MKTSGYKAIFQDGLFMVSVKTNSYKAIFPDGLFMVSVKTNGYKKIFQVVFLWSLRRPMDIK